MWVRHAFARKYVDLHVCVRARMWVSVCKCVHIRLCLCMRVRARVRVLL